jgi:hypothetical protein
LRILPKDSGLAPLQMSESRKPGLTRASYEDQLL